MFIEEVFSEEGLLSSHLKHFEARLGQKEMAGHILKSFEENGIALIEAGTGIGKSLAYLAPAIYWALKKQEKIVISTHTIALQEQLIYKDIPLLSKILKTDIQATLVKGMGNYVCLRKLDEHPLLSLEERKEFQKIEEHLEKKTSGCRSDMPFALHPSTWEKVAAEGDNCQRMKCPHYKECYFFAAREKAATAQILVVNHHLLLVDLKQKKEGEKEKTLLPRYERLIIDEAHNLEQIALDSFASVLSEVELIKLLHRLYSESHPEKSRLHQITQAPLKLSSTLIHDLETAIPHQKKEVLLLSNLAFASFGPLLQGQERKKRITDPLTETVIWKEIKIAFDHLKDALCGLIQSLHSLSESLKEISSIESHLLELSTIEKRLLSHLSALDHFFGAPKVRWVEASVAGTFLYASDLNVATILSEILFKQIPTAILCSATLSTNRSFGYLKERLGLTLAARPLAEHIYDSPFDYQERTLLLAPTDLPAPTHTDFLPKVQSILQKAIHASKGGAFVLFTSYDMLETCYNYLMQKNLPYPLLRQGKTSRHHLLEEFKTTKGAVLFGTSSFWEGVDVPGDALRSVIIVKLPFQVPTEPIYEAYSEQLTALGKNPFLEYAVPQAIIKFKQGFGRLMRTKTDRGCILCLDHRITSKAYGKLFVSSLPSCKTLFDSEENTLEAMRKFY